MDNKYYTPDITDLFVGYECEVYNSDIPLHEITKDNRPMSWKKIIWTESDFDEACFDREWAKTNIRTLFLTKEAIEAEGWEYEDMYRDGGTTIYKKGEYVIDFYGTNKMRQEYNITIWNNRKYVLYNGPCPSINEFRKLMKWLGI
jgi:hypothetical protein